MIEIAPFCACGCEENVVKHSRTGIYNTYINGHSKRKDPENLVWSTEDSFLLFNKLNDKLISIDDVKVCSYCKFLKPNSHFGQSNTRMCLLCKRSKNRESVRSNPEEVRKYRRGKELERKFGITLEEYSLMLDEQLGVCKICKNSPKSGRTLSVDHCHISGKVRGLLCDRCNIALAYIEDKEMYILYLEYLERY